MACPDPCSSSAAAKCKCRKDHDSPWSWLVCFSATFIIATTLGISFNFGVLFPVLMDYFQESRERIAWVGSVQIAFIFALGPLTSALVNRLGCRLTAIIGGLSCVSGLLLSSLASSVYIMYVTYSVLFGFGGSCLYLSSYVITSQYFVKNRSVATGITASGSGIGVLSVAPMLQALLDSFDWRKTYRITAGIISVVCVLCLTFDPTVAKRGENSIDDGIDDRKCEDQKMSHDQGKQAQEERKKWFDLSVFKEKVFVVLTLCNTVASIGHNTPRLHLVRFSEDLDVSAGAASRLFIYIDGLFFGTFYITMLNCVEPSKRASAFGLSALFYGTTIATGPPLAGFMTDRLHTYVPSFILAAATEFAAASLLLILICGKRHTRIPEPLNSGEDHNFEHSTCIWETNV